MSMALRLSVISAIHPPFLEIFRLFKNIPFFQDNDVLARNLLPLILPVVVMRSSHKLDANNRYII